MALISRDDEYVELLLAPLRTCARYKPKFGGNASEGLSLDAFRALYGSDPLYHWMGLDSDLVFGAHKAAGGITSLYRQLGIGCERLFQAVVRDSLDLSESEVKWSYTIHTDSGKLQTLTLDARIDATFIGQADVQERFSDWLVRAGNRVNTNVTDRQIVGAVFEVRQGYKSADSKRQNADLRSGMRIYGDGYLPVILLFSRQVNMAVERRYRAAGLLVLIGAMEGTDVESTYAFCRDIVGFDLAAFLERNSPRLRSEFLQIVRGLLSPS